MGRLPAAGVNDLKSQYPEIAAQWHPTMNGSSLPEQVAVHSNKTFYWLCDKGHTYQKSPDKRVRGEGCPYCSNRKVLSGFNDLESAFPNIASEWDYSQNTGSPKDYTTRSTYRAHWICSTCGHKWMTSIRDRADSKFQTCPRCAAVKRGEARHLQALQKRGGITDPLLIKEWDYENNALGPEAYTPKSNQKAFWRCSKCGYRYQTTISNRAMGRGCACCAGKTVVPGINDLATTHPKLAAEWHPTRNGALRPTDVSYGMATRIWWLCPEGHAYSATLLHRSSGTNCPICNSGRQTSFAEQAVFFYVKKVFPDAISRYKDIFSNGMELDIYIPSIKLGIEYDGMAWHKAATKRREIRKREICKENGIRLLRMMEKAPEDDVPLAAEEGLSIADGPMYEKQHLEKAIRLLLDEIDPESNMWTRRKPVFHSRVDIDLDRDETEIRKYMTRIKGSFAEAYPDLAKEWHPGKNGNLTPDKVKPHSDIKAWWICSDCGSEYRVSAGSRANGTGCPKCGILKSTRSKQKPVLMIDPDTMQAINTFESISKASRDLGINSSNISMVCKGQREKAGGYIWKYAEE